MATLKTVIVKTFLMKKPDGTQKLVTIPPLMEAKKTMKCPARASSEKESSSKKVKKKRSYLLKAQET